MTSTVHGDFSLHAEDNMLIATLRGAWNLEGALTYFSELEGLVQSFDGQPWCRIVSYEDYDLHTPEVTAALPRLALWCQEHGCVQQLYVGCNLVDREALEFSYRDSGMGYVTCDTLEQAQTLCRAWLRNERPPANVEFRYGGDLKAV
ncbi:MAG: hypothetical protein ACPHN3_09045 [Spongiibacter sp.]